MNTLGIALMIIGGGFIILAHYWFVMNTRFENHDQMGASINFDQPFFFGAVLISTGVGFLGLLAWYWCIALAFGLIIAASLYKWWILDKIMQMFRRPNPKRIQESNRVGGRF